MATSPQVEIDSRLSDSTVSLETGARAVVPGWD